ncbi:MAG: hypothetical protein DSZ34_08940, partial [Gammaproteobacteria bacterium]
DGNAQDFTIALHDAEDDLVIQTTATIGYDPHVVIQNDGNVGIGTASPDGILHISTASSGTITPLAAADDTKACSLDNQYC